MFKARKGFTLIELLVVIAIIGILSSVVLASLNSARQKSRDARRISDVKQLQLALELYFDDEGGYPSALSILAGDQIATIPVDPTDGSSYLYAAINANCTSYHIGATLEDASHSALDGDADPAALGALGTSCPDGADSAADFAPTDPIYDVTP